MKTILQLFFLFLIISCKAQKEKTLELKIDKLATEVNELEKKNIKLKEEIYEYKVSKNSFIEIIDKVDNLYNNNFNRFIIFWGILGSLIVLGIPYYITRIQKKIIEAKKIEIVQFSTREINKLEKKFSDQLKEKYIELNDLINSSNAENKYRLENEFTKTEISNLYIASKINEIDKNYVRMFGNLKNAIIKCESIEDYDKIDFFLEKISSNKAKFNLELDKKSLKEIAVELSFLEKIGSVNQDLLQKVIEELNS